MRSLLPAIIVISSAFILSAQAEGDAGFDMRQCKAGAVTFIDPWIGDEFVVKQVATKYTYLCNENGTVSEPVDGDTCRKFGDISLVGEFLKGPPGEERTEAKEYVATYYIQPASPCCGWKIEKYGSDEANQTLSNVKWLSARDSPPLGDLPFGSIEGDAPFGNGLLATVCRRIN